MQLCASSLAHISPITVDDTFVPFFSDSNCRDRYRERRRFCFTCFHDGAHAFRVLSCSSGWDCSADFNGELAKMLRAVQQTDTALRARWLGLLFRSAQRALGATGGGGGLVSPLDAAATTQGTQRPSRLRPACAIEWCRWGLQWLAAQAPPQPAAGPTPLPPPPPASPAAPPGHSPAPDATNEFLRVKALLLLHVGKLGLACSAVARLPPITNHNRVSL